MPNPFYQTQNERQMTKQDAVALLMQQAFQMGTDNFVKKIISNNPQARRIYQSLMQSGDPKGFYLNLMQQNGLSNEQAIELAAKNGIKL